MIFFTWLFILRSNKIYPKENLFFFMGPSFKINGHTSYVILYDVKLLIISEICPKYRYKNTTLLTFKLFWNVNSLQNKYVPSSKVWERFLCSWPNFRGGAEGSFSAPHIRQASQVTPCFGLFSISLNQMFVLWGEFNFRAQKWLIIKYKAWSITVPLNLRCFLGFLILPLNYRCAKANYQILLRIS